MIETDIVNIALETLQKNTHIKGKWEYYALADNGIDGEIVFSINKQEIKIYVEVKRNLRAHQLYRIREIAEAHKPYLLVAEHIFPKIKEELRKNEIAYLEANGNIYLKEPGIYLWIDNQKPIPQEKKQANRAFTKTGLKAIFHFLLNEEVVNYPYRTIAEMAEIGLGNVNNIMNGLKQAGFLLKMDKNEYKLVNKKKLLEKWMAAYEDKLKPALLVGIFRFLKEEDHKNWKVLPIDRDKTVWGGEPGGELLTEYLRPEVLTLYTEENRNDLMKHYRLIPDDKGQVKVYKKFWNYTNTNGNTTDPLLVYVDLMNTGDGRCMETAQKIYHEFLQNKF